MNILLLTSRPEAAQRLQRQFANVNWTDFSLNLTDYSAFDAVLIVESIECKAAVENETEAGGIYISVFKVWKNFLAGKAPSVKLLVAGFFELNHPNYISLHNLSSDFDIATKINQALPSNEPWQNQIPVAGEDVMEKLNLFYEGHHRDGIIITMTKVRQCLNHAYYDLNLRDLSAERFQEAWAKTLYPEINSAKGLNARWINYAPYFKLMPFYYRLLNVGIEDFMRNLSNIFSGSMKLSERQLASKQQAFIDFDGFNRLDSIQLELDQILNRYVNPEVAGTILVIDDDLTFHEQLEAGFPTFRFGHVYAINEIEEALLRKFDIILLDLQLDPAEDRLIGLDYIPLIKEKQPDSILIVVTTHGKTNVLQEALKRGADSFLKKQEFNLRQWNHLFIKATGGKTDFEAEWLAVSKEPIEEEAAKILVIEDEDDWFEKITLLRNKHKYQLTRALTPQQALDLLNEKRNYFELILLDLYFKNCKSEEDKDGLDLISKIKEVIPEIPIIVVTKDHKYETVIEAIEKGANDYLRKDRYHATLWENRFNQYIELKRLRTVVNKFKMS